MVKDIISRKTGYALFQRITILLLLLVMPTLALTACGNSNGKEASKEPSVNLNEPVTLMFISQFADDLDKFNRMYGDKIRAKFPNVTINFVPRAAGTGIVDLVTAGNYPDIMYGNTSDIDNFLITTGLAYDMTDLVKKSNYDLTRFEPILLDNIRNTNPAGALYGLPMPYYGENVLFYNKSLFNKFGVAYPKDGMTWDDTYELAKKMTRVEGGETYRGFSSFISSVLRDNQLAIPYLDPKADKMYESEKWKKLLTNLGRFYEIPNNNRDPKKKSQTEEYNAFHLKLNIAMQVNQFGRYTDFPADTLDWDMVTMPTFKEAPNTGSQAVSFYWYITQTNKHKELSFEILKYLLSDELQVQEAKQLAGVPSLKSTNDAFKVIGQDVPALKGKNIQALYKNKPAPAFPKRDSNLTGADPNKLKIAIESAFNKVYLDQVDVNTALREASDEMDKAIQEKKANAAAAK